jgi:opacity protein-like surface antigen
LAILVGVEVGMLERPVRRPPGIVGRRGRGNIVIVTYRSIVASAALALASPAAVSAADLYPGMKDTPVAYSQPVRWYLRGDYSYSWMEGGELSRAIVPFDSASIDNTWALGGGVGTYFGRGVRGDVTYEWRGSTDVRGTGPGTVSTQFDLRSSLLLASLYYDFRPTERFTPYVGVGLGAAYHRSSGGTIQTACTVCATYGDDSNWSAAGALMAGISYRIDRGGHAPVSIKDGGGYAEPGRLHVDVGYRYLYLGDAHTGNLIGTTFATPGPRLDDITAHEIRVGLRWDIR